MNQKMKAAICTAYGPPEVVKIKEVEKPVPGNKQILVKVMAASLNSGDARIRGLRASWFLRLIMRFIFGFSKPRRPVLGMMISGVVEEVGKEVKRFKQGDAIFGGCGSKMGGHAQYVALKEEAVLAPKPSNASFEEAAAIVFGGMSAVYFLNKAGIQSSQGSRVLIYGATGSVGVAAVEIAKHYNCHVTSVCSERGAELAKSLGSDEIVLYTQQDFRKLETPFDIVFDAVGKTKRKDCEGILKPGGKYASVGSMDVAKETTLQLEFLRSLFENGELRANVDKTYSLDNIVEAHRYVDTERKKGNVVVTMHDF